MPCRFVPGEPDFQGRVASVHEHGLRLHPDGDREELRGYAFHAAIWASLLIVGAAVGLCALLEAGPHTAAIFVGGATWLLVLVWRRAWRAETAGHDHRVVLIDRRRGCLVSIEPGHEESEVSLAYGHAYCLEGPAGQLTSELVMACGDQEVRLRAWTGRHMELRQAIKAYGLQGDLPLSNDDCRRLQTDGSPLVRSLRDALWLGGYRRAWVERPVWTAWQHALWPVFVVFSVFQALGVTLSLRMNPGPALPVEALRRLGPARRLDLPPAAVPAWREVGRAISKGLLYVIGTLPALAPLLFVASTPWVPTQLHPGSIPLRPFWGDVTVWSGLAAYAVWLALCVLLFRMASWKAREFRDSPAPWLLLVSTVMFTLVPMGAAVLLDNLNVAADKGSPVAQFRGRVSAFENWVRKGKGGAHSMTTLTISPTLGIPDVRPIVTNVRRRQVRVGDELCAEVYPGYFGRPWLSRLRDCAQP